MGCQEPRDSVLASSPVTAAPCALVHMAATSRVAGLAVRDGGQVVDSGVRPSSRGLGSHVGTGAPRGHSPRTHPGKPNEVDGGEEALGGFPPASENKLL